MKPRIARYLNLIAVAFLFLVFTNCQNEETFEKPIENSETVENSGNPYIKIKKLQDLTRLKTFVNELKDRKNDVSTKSDKKRKANYNFSIIEDREVYVYTDSVGTTYTLVIKKEKQETSGFSNLVVQFPKEKPPTAFVLNYIPSPEYLDNYLLDNETPFQGTVNYESIDYDDSFDDLHTDKGILRCTQITISYCDWEDGQHGEIHLAGTSCTPSFMFDVTYDICYETDDATTEIEAPGTNEPQTYSGGNENPDSSSTTRPLPLCKNSGETDINGNCVGEEPSEIEAALNDIIDCLTDLQKTEINFLVANPSTILEIQGFLNKNICNDEAKAFAEEAIKVELASTTADEKAVVTALLKGDLDTATDILVDNMDVPQYQGCKPPPCPDEIQEAIAQSVVMTILNAFDGEMNLAIWRWEKTLPPLERTIARGHFVKKTMLKMGAEVPDDVSLYTLGELFKVRIRQTKPAIEPANQTLWDEMKDVGMSIFDVAIIASPIKGGGAYVGLLAKTGTGKITAAALSKFIKSYKTIATTTLKGGKGYKTQRAFEKIHGKASPGNELHHIVEQGGFQRLNVFKFGKTNIHNTKNIIDIPGGAGQLHKKVTGYYNSIDATIHPTLRVREAIKDWPFQKQYDFGIKVLKDKGWDGVTGIIK